MNLATRYLGLSLKNPLIASASPLTLELDNIRRLEDFGAAAVVLPSIFEEQIDGAERTPVLTAARSFFPPISTLETGPAQYLETIRRARAAVGIPVIASLNGITRGGWVDYARLVAEAGASAIELNAYFIPSDPALDGRQVEQGYLDIVRAVKEAVPVPLAVKLSPYFSAPAHMAHRLAAAGADGLVLFNRFLQPDIDLAKLELHRDLNLSRPAEIRLPLLWIGILAGRVDVSLAASTGVDTAEQVLKYLLVGADAVMTTTALLRHGLEHMRSLLEGLKLWLRARNLDSLDQVRGRLARGAGVEATTYERANYIRALQDGPLPRVDEALPTHE